MQAVTLVNINPARNHFKFYEVRVSGCTVCLAWGRIATRGQYQQVQCGSRAAARRFADEKVASKLGRGYSVAS